MSADLARFSPRQSPPSSRDVMHTAVATSGEKRVFKIQRRSGLRMSLQHALWGSWDAARRA